MNVIQAERAVTQWIADTCGLTVDQNIFRRNFPPSMSAGCSVTFDNELTSNHPHVRMFPCQIYGKYLTDEEAWNHISLFTERLFPAYMQPAGDFMIVSALLSGDAMVYEGADDAGTKWYISLNFYLSIREISPIDKIEQSTTQLLKRKVST